MLAKYKVIKSGVRNISKSLKCSVNTKKRSGQKWGTFQVFSFNRKIKT